MHQPTIVPSYTKFKVSHALVRKTHIQFQNELVGLPLEIYQPKHEVARNKPRILMSAW